MMEYSARSLEQLADHLYGLGQRARASIRDDEKSFKRIELVARACAFESAADLLRNAEIKGDEYDRGFADGVKAANRALTAGIEELKRCLIKPKEQVS